MSTCQHCSGDFSITQEDLDFYEKIDVPPPRLCPTCRHQRRLALRNELHLYKRSCDLCKKKIISIFSQTSEYTVYCNTCWWSDSWDPADYAKEYDPQRSFFDQFSELEKSVPHFALFQDQSSENCEYTNYGISNKSCYLALCAYSEDVYYSHGAIQSKSCIDVTKAVGCELCYECVDCTNCYNVLFSKNATNCRDSSFLEDCRGCSDCFCSSGLVNGRFVFNNEQLTEAEYRERMKNIIFTSESIENYKKKLKEISRKIPKKYMHGLNNQNVSGDYLTNCNNLTQCFDCLNECESLAYCDYCGLKCRECYDCSYGGVGMELCYEMNGIVTAYNSKFIYTGRNIQNCSYSHYIYSCENLFGCVGLRQKKNFILNKEYSDEDYSATRIEILKNMKERGEYGEFFPIRLSPFAYNESVAHEHYPLTEEAAVAIGSSWKELPHRAEESSEIEAGMHTCKKCNNQFHLIKQEITFYEKRKLPSPQLCPRCRHEERFKERNPRKLWYRACVQCGVEIQTAYSPAHPEIIYCEKCYLDEMH